MLNKMELIAQVAHYTEGSLYVDEMGRALTEMYTLEMNENVVQDAMQDLESIFASLAEFFDAQATRLMGEALDA